MKSASRHNRVLCVKQERRLAVVDVFEVKRSYGAAVFGFSADYFDVIQVFYLLFEKRLKFLFVCKNVLYAFLFYVFLCIIFIRNLKRKESFYGSDIECYHY